MNTKFILIIQRSNYVENWNELIFTYNVAYSISDRSRFKPIWLGLMTLHALLLVEHVTSTNSSTCNVINPTQVGSNSLRSKTLLKCDEQKMS